MHILKIANEYDIYFLVHIFFLDLSVCLFWDNRTFSQDCDSVRHLLFVYIGFLECHK